MTEHEIKTTSRALHSCSQRNRRQLSILATMPLLVLLMTVPLPVLGAGDLRQSTFSIHSVGQDSVAVTLKWVAHLTTRNTQRPMIYFAVPGENLLRFVTSEDIGWKLIGTDNQTIWLWEIDFAITSHWSDIAPCSYLPKSFCPSVVYPFESFTLDIFVNTDLPNLHFAGSVEDPLFSVRSNVTPCSASDLPSNVSSMLDTTGLPYYYEVIFTTSQSSVAWFLALVLWAIMIVQPIVLCFFLKARKSIGNGNYLQTCVGFLVFLPLLIFTYRSSFAPSWLTLIDLIGSSLIVGWSLALLDRLARYYQSTLMNDS